MYVQRGHHCCCGQSGEHLRQGCFCGSTTESVGLQYSARHWPTHLLESPLEGSRGCCRAKAARVPSLASPTAHSTEPIAMAAALLPGSTHDAPLKLTSAVELARHWRHPARTKLRAPILVGSTGHPASWGYIDQAPSEGSALVLLWWRAGGGNCVLRCFRLPGVL